MPYEPHDVQETATVLSAAFIVGVIAQFLKQRLEPHNSEQGIWWVIAGGFSALIGIGLLYEYTNVSPAFLISIAGIIGWGGIKLVSQLSVIGETYITNTARDKLKVDLDKEEVEDSHGDGNSEPTNKYQQ